MFFNSCWCPCIFYQWATSGRSGCAWQFKRRRSFYALKNNIGKSLKRQAQPDLLWLQAILIVLSTMLGSWSHLIRKMNLTGKNQGAVISCVTYHSTQRAPEEVCLSHQNGTWHLYFIILDTFFRTPFHQLRFCHQRCEFTCILPHLCLYLTPSLSCTLSMYLFFAVHMPLSAMISRFISIFWA